MLQPILSGRQLRMHRTCKLTTPLPQSEALHFLRWSDSRAHRPSFFAQTDYGRRLYVRPQERHPCSKVALVENQIETELMYTTHHYFRRQPAVRLQTKHALWFLHYTCAAATRNLNSQSAFHCAEARLHVKSSSILIFANCKHCTAISGGFKFCFVFHHMRNDAVELVTT